MYIWMSLGTITNPETPSFTLASYTSFIVIIVVVVCFSMSVQHESYYQTNEIGSVSKRTCYNPLKT